MVVYPDELTADFMQTYGLWVWDLGVGGDETTAQVERAAALAYQLPRDGRAWRAVDPLGANDMDTALLRQIEHDLRLWMWAHTKDAKNKTKQPDPIPLPGEAERVEDKVEEAERMAASVAAQLGLFDTGDEGGETDG